MNITIQGYNFNVPDGVLAKFEVGSTITLDEGTASTLKQVTCENLRNNFATKVKKEANGSDLAEEKLRELQAEFSKYAESYSFGVRRVGERAQAMDPVEREARKLAGADISGAYKARHNEKLDKERLAAAVDNLLGNEAKADAYMKRARAIIRERSRTAEDVLEGAGL